MTTLRLDDIAAFEETVERTGAGRRSGQRAPYSPTRRDFLKGVALAGTALALDAIGWLPTARPAMAEHGSWAIWGVGSGTPCNGLGSWVLDDDCNGCNQKLIASILCDSNGYHKGDGYGCYYKHRPNQCNQGVYDGWEWNHAGCCSSRRNKRWRCTDGWYRDNCNWSYAESICRWQLSNGTAC